jgi:hypothetical protein
MASGSGFSLEAFQINVDTLLGHTAVFGYCDSELSFTKMFPAGDSRNLYSGTSKSGWGTYIGGFNVDEWILDYDFLKGAWAPEAKYAYFDLTTSSTWIPSAYYDFILDLILKSSVGYYFDTELDGWVTSCQ